MYTLQEQLHDAESDLLDDKNVLALAEEELEEKYKWIESRKAVVAAGELRVAKLRQELYLTTGKNTFKVDPDDQRDNEQDL